MNAVPAGSAPPTAREFRSLPDLLRQHARRAPHKLALVCGETSWSHGELDARTDAVAASLQQRGVRCGEIVAICATTSLAYCAVFLGALRAGAAVAPLPSSATREQLARMVRDAGARWLFSDADAAAQLAGIAGTELVRVEAWLDAVGAPEPVAIAPGQDFNIIYSSGTTGAPKGIAQSHERRWQHMQSLAALGGGPDAVALLATPLYSNTTLVMLFPMLGLGGTTVLMPRFDAAEYLALAQRHRATHTVLVPVQYQRILACPAFDRHDLSSFRVKLCTGSPCAPRLKREVLQRWPGGLVELYGSTEGAGSCVLHAHRHPDKLHTVGLPSPGCEIRIIDTSGREQPRGVPGEVVGRSSTMMAGYRGQAAASAEVEWFDATGRRFLRTGDIGYLDEDGFLVLVDRVKDMIISGGFNIYPADLEAVLREHADVADVAVVGVPSERWGESPVAFVVPCAGAQPLAEALREWANARLGKTQRLARLHFVDELPRNAMGKILKRELRAKHANP